MDHRKATVQADSVVVVVAEAFLIHLQRWEALANYRLAIQALVTARAAVVEDTVLVSDAPFLDKDISWQSDRGSLLEPFLRQRKQVRIDCLNECCYNNQSDGSPG